MRGIEKFSDITSPWLVDYEDSGWGGDFDIQEQIGQVRERERKFIIDELHIEESPNFESQYARPGSFSNRFLKLKQRMLFTMET